MTKKQFFELSKFNPALLLAIERRTGGWMPFKRVLAATITASSVPGFKGSKQALSFYNEHKELITNALTLLAVQARYVSSVAELVNQIAYCRHLCLSDLQAVAAMVRDEDPNALEVRAAIIWYVLERIAGDYRQLAERFTTTA